MTTIINHHIGDGFTSPCGLEPAAVYLGLQAGFTNVWDKVDCTDCLTKGGRTPDPQPMQLFYLTFGVQYGRELHPTWAGANGNGWVTIEATDYTRARGLAVAYFDLRWSMLNPAAHFDTADHQARYYPQGELVRITQGVQPDEALGLRHFSTSQPQLYGVAEGDMVAWRIEGILKEDSNTDSVVELGYEAETFHTDCGDRGRALFAKISEEDPRVMAWELDWSNEYECKLCGRRIT